MIAHITDHEAQGVARLIERYRTPRVSALLASWLSEVQAVEDALWQLLNERAADNAVGAALDVLGRIVGQAREGRDDDTYRIWVGARILVSRSSGTVTELIAITKRLTQGARVRLEEPNYPYSGSVIVRLETGVAPATGNQVVKLLGLAKAGGVALQFVWFTNAGEPFRFAPGSSSVATSPNGLDTGKLAAVSDGTVDVTFA